MVNLFRVAQIATIDTLLVCMRPNGKNRFFFVLVSAYCDWKCVYFSIGNVLHFIDQIHRQCIRLQNACTHTNVRCMQTFPIVAALKLRTHFELHNYRLGSDCIKSTEACLFANFMIYAKLHVWHISCIMLNGAHKKWRESERARDSGEYSAATEKFNSIFNRNHFNPLRCGAIEMQGKTNWTKNKM